MISRRGIHPGGLVRLERKDLILERLYTHLPQLLEGATAALTVATTISASASQGAAFKASTSCRRMRQESRQRL
jgi:hypothetical protein